MILVGREQKVFVLNCILLHSVKLTVLTSVSNTLSKHFKNLQVEFTNMSAKGPPRPLLRRLRQSCEVFLDFLFRRSSGFYSGYHNHLSPTFRDRGRPASLRTFSSFFSTFPLSLPVCDADVCPLVEQDGDYVGVSVQHGQLQRRPALGKGVRIYFFDPYFKCSLSLSLFLPKHEKLRQLCSVKQI